MLLFLIDRAEKSIYRSMVLLMLLFTAIQDECKSRIDFDVISSNSISAMSHLAAITCNCGKVIELKIGQQRLKKPQLERSSKEKQKNMFSLKKRGDTPPTSITTNKREVNKLKRMQECLMAFQAGLKQMPNDSFLQSGVALLAASTSSVSWFRILCDEEIKKHLGPQISQPYSNQNGWVNNINLAKVMVAWVLGGRQGPPQKLSRQKPATSFSSPSTHPSLPPHHPPLSPPLSLMAPLPPQETTSLEQNIINNAAWWIFEQTLQLPPGSGQDYVRRLIEQIHKTVSTAPLPSQEKINPSPAPSLSSIPPPPPPPSSQSPSMQAGPPPPAPVKYHDSQVNVAQELFEALKQAPGYAQYDEVDFFVIVPPKRTLKVQTRERLISLLWKLCVPAFHNDRATLDRLITQTLHHKKSIFNQETRYDPSNQAWSLLSQAQSYFSQRVMSSCMFRNGEANANFNKLCQAVQYINPTTGKRKMILVIADEAHYGPKRNGQVDILFQGAAHPKTSTYSNPTNILSEPNVFIVNVSATGWNCNVVPHHRIVTWKDIPTNYNSRESYLSSGRNKDKLITSHGFDALVKWCHGVNWLHLDVKSLLPSICLMVDYAVAFVTVAIRSISNTTTTTIHHHGQKGGIGSILPTAETLKIVNHMAASLLLSSQNGEHSVTDTILIRLQRNGAQPVFVSWMKLFRSLLPPPPPPPPPSLSPTITQDKPAEAYKIVCPSFPTISEVPFRDSFETSLQGHRSICIVVERARIGDTIPSMSFFDLRARYKAHGTHAFSQTSFATFTQDVARAFGYQNPAPSIILNQQGRQLFQGQTTNIDVYLQRSQVPVHCLPQIIGHINQNIHNDKNHNEKEIEKNFRDGSDVHASLVPHPLSMWHRVLFAASHHDPQAVKVLDHVKSNRMLLLARSQIGKTGCFIKLIELVLQDKYHYF
jgi:hypothetical protein